MHNNNNNNNHIIIVIIIIIIIMFYIFSLIDRIGADQLRNLYQCHSGIMILLTMTVSVHPVDIGTICYARIFRMHYKVSVPLLSWRIVGKTNRWALTMAAGKIVILYPRIHLYFRCNVWHFYAILCSFVSSNL